MSTCSRCHQPIEQTDCYCRHCGKTLQPRMGFWYTHNGILLLTLLTGPFSLICVWLSRKISCPAKWLWTIGILLFCCYVVYSLCHTILLLGQAASLLLGF